MKTGTTFLQWLLDANRDALLDAGVLVPGSREDLMSATSGILGSRHRTLETLARGEENWERAVARMLAHRGGASVFSHEFFSFADRERAERVMKSLEGAEVHIILTVRDATTALPSQWQTLCRNKGRVSWPQFVRQVRRALADSGPPTGGAKAFFRGQGVPRMLEVWGRAVPANRIHVVTVPPTDSEPRLLWTRFADVIGVDPDVASAPPPVMNPSLGHPSADLMRRINKRLGPIPDLQYAPTLRGSLAGILASRSAVEGPPQLDLGTKKLATTWNRRVRRSIRYSGARVVGDLNDLPAQLADDAAETAADSLRNPPVEEVLAAACTARDGLLEVIDERTDELRALGDPIESPTLDRDGRPTTSQRWAGPKQPLFSAVVELCVLVQAATDLRIRIEVQSAHQPGVDGKPPGG